MIRFLLPLSLAGILLLSACGGSPVCDGTEIAIDTFSICIPKGYRAMTNEFGEDTNYVVHFSDATGSGQILRAYIRKDALLEPIHSPMKFAERAVELARQDAPNYQVISTDPVEVNRKSTLLHIFESQTEKASEPIRYYQFVTTHDGIAYGFTVMLEQGADAEEQQQEIIQRLLKVRFN